MRWLLIAAMALVGSACAGGSSSGAESPQAEHAAAGGATAAGDSLEATDDQQAAGSAAKSQAAAASAAASLPPLPSGPLTIETIGVVVNRNFDGIRQCYLKGLQRDPKLAGWINMRLSIADDGSVLSATAKKDSDKPAKPRRSRRWRRPKRKGPGEGRKLLTDSEVVACVEQAFMAIKFPPTGQGIMSLVYAQSLATE